MRAEQETFKDEGLGVVSMDLQRCKICEQILLVEDAPDPKVQCVLKNDFIFEYKALLVKGRGS